MNQADLITQALAHRKNIWRIATEGPYFEAEYRTESHKLDKLLLYLESQYDREKVYDLLTTIAQETNIYNLPEDPAGILEYCKK